MTALSFAEFVSLFEATLDVSIPTPATEAVIGIHVEMNSIQMLDMIVELEDHGAELPPEVFLEARPLAELHEQYVKSFATVSAA